MAIDAWLPSGYLLPDSARVRVAKYEGTDWQIYETAGSGSALVVRKECNRPVTTPCSEAWGLIAVTDPRR